MIIIIAASAATAEASADAADTADADAADDTTHVHSFRSMSPFDDPTNGRSHLKRPFFEIAG